MSLKREQCRISHVYRMTAKRYMKNQIMPSSLQFYYMVTPGELTSKNDKEIDKVFSINFRKKPTFCHFSFFSTDSVKKAHG